MSAPILSADDVEAATVDPLLWIPHADGCRTCNTEGTNQDHCAVGIVLRRAFYAIHQWYGPSRDTDVYLDRMAKWRVVE